jgi:hypothetical protein
MTCPTISPGVRLRTSRIVPVWQNRQLSVQPTWLRNAQRAAVGIGDEHHLEILPVVGAQQPFAGAVGGMLRLHDFGRPMTKRSASHGRMVLAMSVIASKSVTPR